LPVDVDITVVIYERTDGTDLDLTAALQEMRAAVCGRGGQPMLGSVVVSIYRLALQYKERSTLKYLRVEASLPWVKVRRFYAEEPDRGGEALDAAVAALEEVRARAESAGWPISLTAEEEGLVPAEDIGDFVSRLGDDALKRRLSEFHVQACVSAYIEEEDLDGALVNARAAIRLGGRLNAGELVNLGYVFSRAGEWSRAREVLGDVLVGLGGSLEWKREEPGQVGRARLIGDAKQSTRALALYDPGMV
jgi:hypothetical protein